MERWPRPEWGKLEAGGEEKKGTPGGAAPKPRPLSRPWLPREVPPALLPASPTLTRQLLRPPVGGGAALRRMPAGWAGESRFEARGRARTPRTRPTKAVVSCANFSHTHTRARALSSTFTLILKRSYSPYSSVHTCGHAHTRASTKAHTLAHTHGTPHFSQTHSHTPIHTPSATHISSHRLFNSHIHTSTHPNIHRRPYAYNPHSSS